MRHSEITWIISDHKVHFGVCFFFLVYVKDGMMGLGQKTYIYMYIYVYVYVYVYIRYIVLVYIYAYIFDNSMHLSPYLMRFFQPGGS